MTEPRPSPAAAVSPLPAGDDDVFAVLFGGALRELFERRLGAWLEGRRWYRTKTSKVLGARVESAFVLPRASTSSRLALVDLTLEGERRETYVVPFTLLRGERAATFRRERPTHVVFAGASAADGDVLLVDGLAVPALAADFLDAIGKGLELACGADLLRFHATPAFRHGEADVAPRLVDREQTNTSILYGKKFVGKVVRKLDEGVSPDLELGRFLTDVGFRHAPALAGYVDVVRGDPSRVPSTVGLLHELVPNEGDAWEHLRGVLRTWMEGALRAGDAQAEDAEPLLALARRPPSARRAELVGPYLELARTLGLRTGQMHAALASRPGDPVFAPEALDAATRKTLAVSAQKDFARIADALAERAPSMVGAAGSLARELTARRSEVELRLDRISFLTDAGARMRVHGDYHLGQVLVNAEDFMIIDFEGEPARPLAARKAKRSPLVDVAGMLRSFDYAVSSALREVGGHAAHERLMPWASLWRRHVSAAFLRGYLSTADGAGILPASWSARHRVLDFFLLEKSIYEIGYEIDNRPDWLDIPLRGMIDLLSEADMGETE